MFKKINIVPQWGIFIFDIFISVFALFLAFMLRNEFGFSQVDKTIFFKNAVLLIGLCIVVFAALKTYTGIISLTSIQDAFRIFIAVILINVGIVVTYLIASLFFKKSFISLTTLSLNAFLQYFFLIVYRLALKHVFFYFKNLKIESKNVFIYGTDIEALETRRVLDEDKRVNYNIVGFIDDDKNVGIKEIDDIKIYRSSELPSLLKAEKVDGLILASDKLSIEKKNFLVDACIGKGIEVMITPPVKTWINAQLSARRIHLIGINELLEEDIKDLHTDALEAQVKNKRIMVTGAAGSLGSQIVAQLLRFNPSSIILVDTAETALYESELMLRDQHTNILFRYFIADVRNYKRMEQIFIECKPHSIFHAAAYKHVPTMEQHPYEAVATNVIGAKNIVDLSVKYAAEKFVLVSSDKAMNPANVMGATKRIAEIYAQSLYNHLVQQQKHPQNWEDNPDADGKRISLTKIISTRFGNVFESAGSVLSRFKMQISQGGPVTITHPEISRYFMANAHACQLILEASGMSVGGEIFVFNTGRLIKINDLANKMIRLAGLTPGADIDIKYTGLRPGEKLHEEPSHTPENTISTYHNEIMIAKTKEYDYEEVVGNMNTLISMIQSLKTENDIVTMIKKMVPEYVSANSVFERLDQAES